MKINLQVKIIGIVFLISFVIFSILSYINFTAYRDGLTDAFVKKASSIARSLDVSISKKDDLNDKHALLSNIHKQLWLDPDIVEINFVIPQTDGSFNVHVSNNSENVDQVANSDNKISYDQDKIITTIDNTSIPRMLRVIAPVHVSAQILGTYEMNITLESVDAALAEQLRTMLIVFISMLGLFIFILFFFLRQIVIKPVSLINDGMSAVTQGNLDYKMKLKSGDEIGALARQFTVMTGMLKKSNKQLSDYSKNLEKKVNERTKKLQESNDALEKFNKLAVGRELKMIELKEQVRALTGKRSKNKFLL